MWVREWLGAKVIDLDTGGLLGRVVRLVATANRMAAAYLVLRPGDMRRPLLILPWEKVYPGNPALAAMADCQPLTPDTACWRDWACLLPLGLPGLSAHGQSPGRCLDAWLDEKGRITRLTFASGAALPAGAVACVGSEAIILAPEARGDDPPQEAEQEPSDSRAGGPESPLLGRVVTQPVIAPDGVILAREGQIVDEALIEAASRAQRRVALTVHSRPAQEA